MGNDERVLITINDKKRNKLSIFKFLNIILLFFFFKDPFSYIYRDIYFKCGFKYNSSYLKLISFSTVSELFKNIKVI